MPRTQLYIYTRIWGDDFIGWFSRRLKLWEWFFWRPFFFVGWSEMDEILYRCEMLMALGTQKSIAR